MIAGGPALRETRVAAKGAPADKKK